MAVDDSALAVAGNADTESLEQRMTHDDQKVAAVNKLAKTGKSVAAISSYLQYHLEQLANPKISTYQKKK